MAEEEIPSLDWNDTLLKDDENTSMLATDIKQLLISRGMRKGKIKGKKADLIKLLKTHYKVIFHEQFQDLTIKQIKLELKLLGLTERRRDKLKWQLIQRLIDEIKFKVCVFSSFNTNCENYLTKITNRV